MKEMHTKADWSSCGIIDITDINKVDEAFGFCKNKEGPSLWKAYALHLVRWM